MEEGMVGMGEVVGLEGVVGMEGVVGLWGMVGLGEVVGLGGLEGVVELGGVTGSTEMDNPDVCLLLVLEKSGVQSSMPQQLASPAL